MRWFIWRWALREAGKSIRAKSARESAAGLSPQSYEAMCRDVLRQYGWDARTTAATGDQGADVVASKLGQAKTTIRLVLQCKLYSNPVGNKAVQEAYAAQAHFRATYAAVVTNATYTQSAQSLAATTGVKLLRTGDLHRINTIFPV